jgi:hypothetical protein
MTDENTEAPKPAKRRGRPPGLPRTPGSGRKKGVPNKLNGTIHDMMKALGCDPRMILARIAMNPKNNPELRRKCASDLMNFMYPRLASTEQHVTGEMQQTIVQVVTGIARSPTDPPLSAEETARWRSAIDVTPTLPPPPPAALEPPAAKDPSISEQDPVDAMPAGRSWHPYPPPVETPRPALSPASDRLHDDRLQHERRDDAKIAELNSRAAKFVA